MFQLIEMNQAGFTCNQVYTKIGLFSSVQYTDNHFDRQGKHDGIVLYSDV